MKKTTCFLFLCFLLLFCLTTKAASGIYLRGEVNSWAASADWEFTEEGDGVYTLLNKTVKGQFKIADASWSKDCNYGSNGDIMTANHDYILKSGDNPGNISCGSATIACTKITLTIKDGTAILRMDGDDGRPQIPENYTPEATTMKVEPANVILVPELPSKIKVLSLNNSLIYYNGQRQVFNDICKAMGKDASWVAHTNLGKTLNYHFKEADDTGNNSEGQPSAKTMIKKDAWTHIILQEQSSLPRTDPATVLQSVTKWIEYIRESCPNPNAIVIMPINWAYSSDKDNFATYNKKFVDNCLDIAQRCGITLCPVAVAYDNCGKDDWNELLTWFQDDRHPTEKSTYLAACMEYATIFGEDPLTITYAPSSVSDADALKMRQYASQAWKGFSQPVSQLKGTVSYKATVYDQYNVKMTVTENPVFTLSGTGSLSSDGVYTAGDKGTSTISASVAGFLSSTSVDNARPKTTVKEEPALVLSNTQTKLSENFDGMSQDEPGTLPKAWRIDRPGGAPRTVGYYLSAVDTLQYAGGVSLPKNAKNGTWNFGEGSDRAVGGISTGVDGGTRCINVYVHIKNIGEKIESPLVEYDVEKYRKGSNAAGFNVQMFYSADGNSWTSAGDDFLTHFNPDNITEGYAVIPGKTVHVTHKLPVTLNSDGDLYLAWNISVASGTNCASAMALAIDNFVLTTKDATAIKSIELKKGKKNVIYNLAGQQVRDGFPGLKIINGKKYLK